MTSAGRFRRGALENVLDRLAPGAAHAAVVFMVRPSRILLPPWYPPRVLDEESMAEFTEEVLTRGKPRFQPLLARPLRGDRFELIAGRLWLEAARRIGYETIPVKAIDLDEPTAIAITLTDVLARERLTPWEEAQGLAELDETLGELDVEVTTETLATLMGHSSDWVRSRLLIASRLPPEVLEEAGVTIHDLNVLPEDTLVEAARGGTSHERARRLRHAYENREELRSRGGRKPGTAAP